ncbi:MAG: MBL fold metallo-hydrolase [Leptolinea sp.]|jgi:metallo-beta-lactamase class B|nr:MBL fold metallo-hydrolase [Leptolinea sp.]
MSKHRINLVVLVFLLFIIGFFASACGKVEGQKLDPTGPGNEKPSPTQTIDRPVSPRVIERIEISSGLFLRKIGDGAYVITGTIPWEANSVLVEMSDESLVMAGSPATPYLTQQVLDWSNQHFGNRKMIEINTGYHADNLGGNQAFIESGIPVYGSELTARLIGEKASAIEKEMLTSIGEKDPAAYSAQQKAKYLPPDNIFPIGKGLDLTFGNETVKVFFPGPSQSPDKVVVYFPSRKLLFGSCMIVGWDKLGNTMDADMKKWPEAIHKLEQFPVDVVVPGHGDRLDPGLIQHTLDLLQSN